MSSSRALDQFSVAAFAAIACKGDGTSLSTACKAANDPVAKMAAPLLNPVMPHNDLSYRQV